jgi:DNA-binding GntR family transcriptional regulator
MADPTSAPPTRGTRLFRERWEIVQDDIRRRILTGEIRPGSPIKEVEIAESLGVSRGPVREAIRALEVSGLISRRPQRTSIVTPITKRDVDELYSLRTVIEDLAISRSIELHPGPLATDLKNRLAALTAGFHDKADPATLADLDIGVHGAFYEWADHSRLEATWATIRDPLRLMMAYTNTGLEPVRRRDAGHQEIVDAAVAGDAARTRQLAAQHLAEARTRILAFVDE